MPVEREIASEESGVWGNDSDTEQRMLVVSCPIGAEPRSEAGVPVKGSTYPPDPTLRCTAVEKLKHIVRSPSEGVDRWMIRIQYSSGDISIFPQSFNDFRVTYSLETIPVPMFKKVIRYGVVGAPNIPTLLSQSEWVPEPLDLPLQFMYLEVRVVIPSISLSDIVFLRSQTGAIHHFPQGFPDEFSFTWQMQGPNIRPISTTKIEVVYAWASDPGNGAFEIEGYVTPLVERKPFWRYLVQPSSITNPSGPPPFVYTDPVISTFDPFPPGSRYYQPDGYQFLLGHPIP